MQLLCDVSVIRFTFQTSLVFFFSKERKREREREREGEGEGEGGSENRTILAFGLP